MVADPQTFEAQIGHVERLVDQIEHSSDATLRETTREIVRALLELHGAGLRRMLQLLGELNGGGKAVLDACRNDDLVRSLLLLHDLHPETLEQRVAAALDRVRPYLRSHGGDVELLEVSAAGVRLRLAGSCHGCPSSEATLRDTVEQAILEIAPDAAVIEVEGLYTRGAPAGLVSLELPQADHKFSGNSEPTTAQEK